MVTYPGTDRCFRLVYQSQVNEATPNQGMYSNVSRRRVLGTVIGGSLVGVAGCATDDPSSGADEPPTDEPTPDQEDQQESSPEPDFGAVYAFGPNTVAVIDPGIQEIIREFTDEFTDEDWGDPQLTLDKTELYVIRGSPPQVVVFDTARHEIRDMIDIGPGGTHIYHPHPEEIWAHSDDEGRFYVIDTTEHAVVETVDAGRDGEGHGKLLYHPDFEKIGYGTNVNDPGLAIIDLTTYDRTGFIEFSGSADGTHYKAYSPHNELAYVEFGDATKIVDTTNDEVIGELPYAGGMYLTPQEERLSILDGDTIRILDVTNTESQEIESVSVEGGPDALRYYKTDEGSLYGITANTMNDQATVLDFESYSVINTLDIGDIERPDGAPFLHRTGMAADDLFVTPADADGTVALIDFSELSVLDHVPVEEGVDTVQIIADAGTGYTGRIQ